MKNSTIIRKISKMDYESWLPLWNGYNAFYGREGPTALPTEITEKTWERFFDESEPIFAFVAVSEGKIIGLTHYLYHRSTIKMEDVCYLQDLFTLPAERGRGTGRLLIESVYHEAATEGIKRVYWHTYETNSPARLLYDKVAKHVGAIVYGNDM